MTINLNKTFTPNEKKVIEKYNLNTTKSIKVLDDSTKEAGKTIISLTGKNRNKKVSKTKKEDY